MGQGMHYAHPTCPKPDTGVSFVCTQTCPQGATKEDTMCQIEVVIRLLVPTYRKPVTGTMILGVVLIGIGIGNIYGWEVTGPFILIALGLAIILRGVTRRQ